MYMENRVLVFDFDGTIADTFNHVLTISNRLSAEYGFKKVKPHEVDLLKGMRAQEILFHLQIPRTKAPVIIARVWQELRKEIAMVKPVKGVKHVLLQLEEYGYKMGILTSNSRKNVKAFLDNNELKVDFISSSSKIMGKTRRLKALIVKQSLNSSNILYIGDEVRDIEAAQKAGIRIAAVTWGYNSKKALEAYKPDYLVTKPEELLQICVIL